MLCCDTKGTLTQNIMTIELKPPWCEIFEQELLLLLLLLFADLTTSEFVSQYTGYKPNNVWSGLKSTHTEIRDVVGTFSFSFIWVVQCATQAHMLHARTDLGDCVSLAQDQVSVCAIVPSTFHACLHMSVRLRSFAVTLHLWLKSGFILKDFDQIHPQVNLSGHELEPIKKPCAQDPTEWGVPMALWPKQPLLQWLWAQRDRQLRLPAETWYSDLPEWVRVSVDGVATRNRRTRSMRNSHDELSSEKRYGFTTVHSGARRISEPETNLSLFWRKFRGTSSVTFSARRRLKYVGDPCTNQVKFAAPSKNGNQVATWKTSNQDSPCKLSKFLPTDLRKARTSSRWPGGCPKAGRQQAAADSRGTCLCANTVINPAVVNARHVVRGMAVLSPKPSVAVRGCARVTGKAGENGQNSDERQVTLDKTVGSRVWL